MPYSVIIRTIDLGGDKLSKLGLNGFAEEANPFLGLRGIRLCLKYPLIFKTQLRAALRASAEGRIKIMYPLVSTVTEIVEANKLLTEAKEELSKEGKKFDENIEIGAMIEVPSAAMSADLIAKEVDFMSLGTNDLIQYTLAVDRVNENVASLYDPFHPSILRLIKMVIEAGHNAGKWVGMCGEMAADPALTAILIGLGLNEFSISPVQIPKIKKIIRSLSLMESKALVKEMFESSDWDSAVAKIKKHPVP